MIYGAVGRIWKDGGFRSIADRLPYLARLGVDVVWLWPPVARRAWGEEYAITDYFSLDPSWGTPGQLRALVQRAHGLGMRVIVDIVPNHTSDRHRWFRRAQRGGPGSAYWDYYERRADGAAGYYFDWANLPNLNFGHPRVRATMTRAFQHWIDRFDLDGFRVDVAWGVRRRAPAYWPQLTSTLRGSQPGLLLLAEASARQRYWSRSGFDLAYDWTDRLGEWAWDRPLADPAKAGARLGKVLAEEQRQPTSPDRVLRFLDNNDTGRRFVSEHGPAVTKVAVAVEFSVPGVPLLFAGQEIGVEYEPYTDPLSVHWVDRWGMLAYHRQLVRLRDALPALWGPRLRVLETGNPAALAFVRPTHRGGQPVLVLANFGVRPAELRLPIRGSAGVLAGERARDLLQEQRLHLDGGRAARHVTVAVPPRSARLLVGQGS